MFRRGQIAIKQPSSMKYPEYDLVLNYAVEKREQGPFVNFDLSGQVAGNPVHECFSLHGDVAYNFLQSVGLRLRKYGLRLGLERMPELHADFEKAYADLRQQLGIRPGQPVDLARFLNERP